MGLWLWTESHYSWDPDDRDSLRQLTLHTVINISSRATRTLCMFNHFVLRGFVLFASSIPLCVASVFSLSLSLCFPLSSFLFVCVILICFLCQSRCQRGERCDMLRVSECVFVDIKIGYIWKSHISYSNLEGFDVLLPKEKCANPWSGRSEHTHTCSNWNKESNAPVKIHPAVSDLPLLTALPQHGGLWLATRATGINAVDQDVNLQSESFAVDRAAAPLQHLGDYIHATHPYRLSIVSLALLLISWSSSRPCACHSSWWAAILPAAVRHSRRRNRKRVQLIAGKKHRTVLVFVTFWNGLSSPLALLTAVIWFLRTFQLQTVPNVIKVASKLQALNSQKLNFPCVIVFG